MAPLTRNKPYWFYRKQQLIEWVWLAAVLLKALLFLAVGVIAFVLLVHS